MSILDVISNITCYLPNAKRSKKSEIRGRTRARKGVLLAASITFRELKSNFMVSNADLSSLQYGKVENNVGV